jgi:hypothetical protein
MSYCVTAPLLPRFLCLGLGNKVGVIDEVIKECVPCFGVDASGLDHVFQFFDPVIGQSTDCSFERLNKLYIKVREVSGGRSAGV